MPAATLSLNETQAFTALRSYLLGVLPPIEVIKGQQNRVGEPQGQDFVVIWPLAQNRLATNYTIYSDNQINGSITRNTLTVFQIISGTIGVGQLLFDINSNILAGTVVATQLTPLTFLTSGPPQTISSRTIYCGVRSDLVATQWSVQCDVHGPNSADNARIIEGLFRSEYGTNAFDSTKLPVGYVTPLYCDTATQVPFINAEQEWEYRWVLNLQLQLNPSIGTVQQFADHLTPTSVPVDIIYRS